MKRAPRRRPAATGSASVERTLGMILGALEAIDGRLERADESRAVIHRRMDELVGRTGDLESEVRPITADMTEVKAVTDEVTRWKQMGLGALGVTGLAAGAIGSALTYFWSDLMRLLRG